LKPGESKKFTFTFRSLTAGVYVEEWELLTDPMLHTPLPKLSLSGMAIKEEEYVKERQDLSDKLIKQSADNTAMEILNDVIEAVKTPTPPLPDMSNPEIFREIFETNNKKYELWYTPSVQRAFVDLWEQIIRRMGKDIENEFWDGSVDSLEVLINEIVNPWTKKNFMTTLVRLISYAKSKPLERAISYDVFSQVINKTAEVVPKSSE
jgi:hypothetical protein